MIELPKRILAATGNKNKIRELSTVAVEHEVEIISPQTLANELKISLPPDPIENADTYKGNALIKAKALYQWSGMPTIADDSGLEVAALGGGPGIYSARYGGANLSDKQRYEFLLREVNAEWQKTGNVNREAAFVCSLVLILDGNNVFYANSRIEGQVLDEPRGSNGFGYDPIIYINSIEATLAEVDFSVTCSKGFRAQAMRNLISQFIPPNS